MQWFRGRRGRCSCPRRRRHRRRPHPVARLGRGHLGRLQTLEEHVQHWAGLQEVSLEQRWGMMEALRGGILLKIKFYLYNRCLRA